MMGAGGTFEYVFTALFFSTVQIGVAVFIVSQAGARRSPYGLRIVTTALALLACTLLCTGMSVLLFAALSQSLLRGVTFVLILLEFVGAVLFCHDVTALTALCYATTGYAAQNLSQCIVSITEVFVGDSAIGEALFSADHLLSAPLVLAYAALYLFFLRNAKSRAFADADDAAMLLISSFVVVVVIVYDIAVQQLDVSAIGLAIFCILRATQAMVCAFIVYTEYEMLYNRRLRAEKAASARLLAEAGRQYELSRETVETVNIMCHDIRHQIRDLREEAAALDDGAIDALERRVGAYDAHTATGNDALDVIITEKRLQCEREGIELTCIADGRTLAMLDSADLYALVGNALDNAIEASRALPEGERTVSLTVREACGMASLHVENRYDDELRLEDGMPATTKADRTRHGYGTRSMHLVAERHGGTLSFSAEDGTFIVNALLPLQTG